MKLSTIIRQARNGELKSLSPVDKTDEVVTDYINLAMVALYNRFPLSMKEAIVTLDSSRVLYTLDGTDTNVSVNGLPIKEDSLAVVVVAYNEAGKVTINDENDDFSIHTPTYDTVQVPSAMTGDIISLIYRANPTLIEPIFDSNGAMTDDPSVKVPMVLLEPMLHYIGYRAHGSVDGAIEAEANTHLMRFKASCKEIEDLGLLPTDSTSQNMETSTRGIML